VRVLVIDDSAVARESISAILSKDRGTTVETASDPVIGLQKMAVSRPDVIVLDLEMPRMDGITFLRKVMGSDDPIPVVVCSSLAVAGGEAAVRALEEGAVSIVTKPKVGVREFLYESAVVLTDAVIDAAEARAGLRRMRRSPPAAPGLNVPPKLSADAMLPPVKKTFTETTDQVVAIGASTGGTEALREVLEAMPPDAPGIVIVQHMPELFTRAFAQRLDSLCRIEVKEAADGDRVWEGRALIAPGNRHTMLRRSGAHYIVRVADGPLVSRHRPSVNVLFRSVAQAAGPNAVGVIMTGMGDDGADGLLEMRQAGARTIAQDEASCVVFGMPREAIARGGVQEVAPLPRIARQILAFARHSPLSARPGLG
jgi:two-component system chemotaxis response regulator CheB